MVSDRVKTWVGPIMVIFDVNAFGPNTTLVWGRICVNCVL